MLQQGMVKYWDSSLMQQVIKLLPGQYFVCAGESVLATTLGSCVSACLWDKALMLGGMNHFMLPVAQQKREDIRWGGTLSAANRYGNFAMESLINEMIKRGARRDRLVAKVFGGARMVAKQNGDNSIGYENCEFVFEYLKNESIALVAKDVLGSYPRKILFFPRTGIVKVKQLIHMNNNTVSMRENSYKESLLNHRPEGDVELFD